MWIVDKICGKNIGSYLELNYDVLQGKTVSIIGDNRDDPGQESNGAGKSWLQEAFAIGLIGMSLKKVRNSDLIRTGTKLMEIDLYMSNAFLKMEMIIHRRFPVKGSATLMVNINGVDQANKFPGGDGDRFILDKIGISREDLLGYYLISKTRYKSYLSASDTVKKEVISRFSGADMLEGVDDLVDGQVAVLEGKKRTVEDLRTSELAKKEVYEAELLKEQDVDFEADKSNRILDVERRMGGKAEDMVASNKNIELYRGEIVGVEETKKELGGKLLDVGSVKDKELLVVKIQEVIDELLLSAGGVDKMITTEKKNKTDFVDFLVEINNSLKGAVKCPACMHEFNVSDEKIDIAKARAMIPNIQKKIDHSDLVIKKLNKDRMGIVDRGKDKRNEMGVVAGQVNEVRRKVSDLNRKIDDCDTTISKKNQYIKSETTNIELSQNAIVEYKKRIIEIREEERKSRESEIKKNIKDSDKEIVLLAEKLLEHEGVIFKERQWIYNFKKFNSYLAVQAIKTIEGRMNIVLESFESDLRVELEGFRVLANNTIREKITTHVWRDDGERGVLERFSAGEKARVEVAAIVALQSLINQSADSGGLNFLMIDEIMESVDSYGIEIILNNLNKTDKTVILVTHVGVDSINYEHVLLAIKENGETTLSG